MVPRMGIKAIEQFDGKFELEEAAREALAKLLSSATFSQQVRQRRSLRLRQATAVLLSRRRSVPPHRPHRQPPPPPRPQVARECKLPEGSALEFTGMLFQPVPWSPGTTKGMPAEYEQYHAEPEYTIINVPPNFMFTCKIMNPSRLCAIYKRL